MLSLSLLLSLSHPKKTIAISIVLLFLLMIGVKNLSFTNDFRVYFSEENPQLQAYERFEAEFSEQQNLYFGVYSQDGAIFTRSTLHLIEQITAQALSLPYTDKAYSLSNYQYITAEEDTLSIDDFYQDAQNLSQQQIDRLRDIALNDEALINYYISSNERLSGINVSVNLPDDNLQAAPELMAAARVLRDTLLAHHPDIKIIIGGSIASNAALSEGVKRDLKTLVVASYGLIILGLWFFLRSFWAMFATLVIVSLSVLSTFGLFGYASYVLTPISGFVPSIVLTIAVADSVHVLVSYRYALSQGLSPLDALKEAMRINVGPVFLTSITTITGVLCLNFSDSPPYRDLGNMVAVGVFWAWLYSMLVLPCLIRLLPVHRFAHKQFTILSMDKMSQFVHRYQNSLILVIGSLVVISVFYLKQNRITENWAEYFDDSFEITRAITVLQENVNAVHRLEYMLDTGKDGGVHSVNYFNEVDNFYHWLKTQPEVSHVTSMVYPLKKMHLAMHNDDPSYFVIPNDDELIAQYLLLYEMSANSQGMSHLINLEHSMTRLSVLLRKMDSDRILAFEQKTRQWLNKNTTTIQTSEATSLDIIFAHIAKRNIYSLLTGTALALVIISCLLLIALKSFKLGLISLVPNLVPATLAYGTWGMLVGHIDMALSIVICMSLGIVVDDTVHFLSKYKRAKKEKALSTQDAIDYAFRSVGSALITTSVVLVCGFLILIFSGMTPTRETGTLLAVTLSYALFVDFLLLPPLLLKLDK